VEDAIRGVTSGAGGATQVVGDLGAGGGGAGPGLQTPGSSSRPLSSLELLSDPKGVDFRPYLIQVLTAVRRNWFAVIPESARFGRRGKTQIQFAISRDGRVPKLVISLPSGTESLDRAAVAGISASNPFPPLPAHFPSEQIRLQLTFAYNPQ
jgi:TonB family protein